MKNLCFGILTTALFLAGCGSSESASKGVQVDNALTAEYVCNCLSEMDETIAELLEEAEAGEKNLRQLMSEMNNGGPECMRKERSKEETKAFAKLQSDCPGFKAFEARVKSFQDKLVALKEKMAPSDNIKDMKEIAPGGAQELLDKLKNGNKR